MATVAELKERLQSLNRRTSKAKDIWKPSDEHEVRLLPYPHGEDPFLEQYFHYEIGDASVLCPKMNFGDDCAICDFCDQLKSFNDARGNKKPEKEKKEDWEIFKKIQPKARVFIPMVERGKEAEDAKFWGVTGPQATEILNVCTDGDRLAELGVSPDDPTGALKVLFGTEKGYDLKVSFAKPGEKGNDKKFPVIKITGGIKAKPVAKDKATTEKLLSSVKNIREVYPKVPSTEVEKLLKRFMGSQATEANLEGGTEYNKKEETPTNSKENAKVTGTRSIDEAFDDLLEQA